MPTLVLKGLALTLVGTTALVLILAGWLIVQLTAVIVSFVPFVGGRLAADLRRQGTQLLQVEARIWDSHLYYVSDLIRIIWAFFSSMFDGIRASLWDLHDAIWRVSNIQIPNVRKMLWAHIEKRYLDARVYALTLHKEDDQLIAATYAAARKYTQDEFGLAEQNLVAGLRAETAYVDASIKAAIGTIDAEAAAGFASAEKVRGAIIGKILDLLATHEPLVKDLVDKLAGVIADFLTGDFPELRPVVTFLVNAIVNKLGVDNAVAALLSAVIDPLIGVSQPKTLQEVIAELEAQDVAMQTLWEQLNGSGLPQIEQAGRLWEGMASPLFIAALTAWLTQAVADPQAWARETQDAFTPIIDIELAAVRAWLSF